MDSIKLEQISKYYISGRIVTMGLNTVSLHFEKGEFVAVTGESGSGKSTLANILAGILPFESGEMWVNGESTARYSETDWQRYRRDTISYVAQDYGILPGNTVWENVTGTLRLAGLSKDMVAGKAEALLKQVDLWKYKKRRASHLSSGQKQRLAIAGALAKPAGILVADEPTANLDVENSRKILQLLADAAKERLVIMITHDFRLAKEYATRQVVLHDGQVVSDTPLAEVSLSETEAPAPAPETLSSQKQKGLGRYIAGLQLHGRPVWSMTVLLLFALTGFAFFVFLGTFIASLDDTSTRIYDNEAFYNGDDTRLVVARSDGAPMTEEDYGRILSLTWADSLERYDTALDVNYYYREDTDYGYRYSMDISDMLSATKYSDAVIFRNNSLYVHTIPLLKDDEAFLTAGALPAHMNEVVMAGDESLIGTSFPVFIWDRKNWSQDSYIYLEVTVVGVTDHGSGLYFDERVGRMLYQSLTGVIYGVDPTLADDEVTLTVPMLERYVSTNQVEPDILDFIDMNTYLTESPVILSFSYAGTNLSKPYPYYEFSESTFDRINLREASLQAALFLKDYSFADRAIDALQKMGYEAVSPYRVSSVKLDTEKANARLNTLVLCIFAVVMVAAAQLIILSALFRLEMKDYTRLSHRGMSCLTGRISLLWQILLFAIVGQLLAAVLVSIGNAMEMAQIYNIFKYLTPLHIILISLLHLLLSLLVAFIVGNMLQNMVFPFTRREEDVDLDELKTEEVTAQ